MYVTGELPWPIPMNRVSTLMAHYENIDLYDTSLWTMGFVFNLIILTNFHRSNGFSDHEIILTKYFISWICSLHVTEAGWRIDIIWHCNTAIVAQARISMKPTAQSFFTHTNRQMNHRTVNRYLPSVVRTYFSNDLHEYLKSWINAHHFTN